MVRASAKINNRVLKINNRVFNHLLSVLSEKKLDTNLGDLLILLYVKKFLQGIKKFFRRSEFFFCAGMDLHDAPQVLTTRIGGVKYSCKIFDLILKGI